MRGVLGFLSLVAVIGIIIWISMTGLKGFMGSGDSQQLDGARSRSQAVVCRTNRKMMDTAINQFRSSHPGEPVTIESLEAAGVAIPECPAGGQYTIAGGRVVCSIHRE